jgi:hypothetical protein
VRTPFLRRRTGMRRWLRLSISSSSQTPSLVRKIPGDDVYGYLQGWKYRTYQCLTTTVPRRAARYRNPGRGRANRCRFVARRLVPCTELFERVQLTAWRKPCGGKAMRERRTKFCSGDLRLNARQEARMTYGKANASREAIPRKEGICWGAPGASTKRLEAMPHSGQGCFVVLTLFGLPIY